MAWSVNGFGTAFYGESDYRTDGSFITTEWICAAYLPLIPLKSLRLLRDDSADVNAIVLHSVGYRIQERLPLYWMQVIRVYAFVAVLLLWWLVASWLCFARFDIATDPRAPWIVSIWVIAMAAPIVAVTWVRRTAWKHCQSVRSHYESNDPRA